MRLEFSRLSSKSRTYGAQLDRTFVGLGWQPKRALWRVVLFFPGQGVRPIIHRADVRGRRMEAEQAAARRIVAEAPPDAISAHQRIALALSVGPEERETFWDVYH